MKKLVVMIMAAMLATIASAASFKWSAANIYGPDGNKFTGTADLYAVGVDGVLQTANVSAGAVSASATQFSTDKLTGGNTYDFYFVITDSTSGKQFTSPAKEGVLAQATSTVGITFGNMQNATQASNAWATVPEPTSALLMVLGIAGLALKRKRV